MFSDLMLVTAFLMVWLMFLAGVVTNLLTRTALWVSIVLGLAIVPLVVTAGVRHPQEFGVTSLTAPIGSQDTSRIIVLALFAIALELITILLAMNLVTAFDSLFEKGPT